MRAYGLVEGMAYGRPAWVWSTSMRMRVAGPLAGVTTKRQGGGVKPPAGDDPASLPTGPVPPAPPAGRRPCGPLRERDFRLLWSGQAVSAVGDRIYPVAIALRVLEGGGSATDLGLVLGAFEVALVVFVLAGGVVSGAGAGQVEPG